MVCESSGICYCAVNAGCKYVYIRWHAGNRFTGTDVGDIYRGRAINRGALKVPDVHLTEFTDALSHGEVLLMVDVPSRRVAEIENFIYHRFPEAVVGGVGWTLDAFGI